ncbi:MAG: transposase [Deltaproteobacteria bacterium]|nr:transposase [Deltaproteobacteria bacterium]
MIREQKHRLSPELYCGNIIGAFTACITGRVSILNKIEVFSAISQIFFDSLNSCGCNAHVYLFMPDHCHLLIQGNDHNSDLLRFMKHFKQRSGFWFSKNIPGIKWQKDFYDHILRNDEDIKKQVYYILENPVRKRLVDTWKDYPYKGSTIYNFEEW